MKVSDAGLRLVQEFEGFCPEPYADVGDKQSIGYGHLIRKGEVFTKLTEAEATALLCRDLEVAEACVEDAVEVPITQHQFDALCSLAYNIGCGAFRGSTLLKLLNAGQTDRASEEFPKWCRVGQNMVNGLLRRRLAEQLLFRSA